MEHVLWILLLLPGADRDRPAFFPGSFSTKEACLDLGETLLQKGRFTCLPSLREIKLAGNLKAVFPQA